MTIKNHLLAAGILFSIFTSPLYAAGDTGDFIRLIDPLDEPEFYCLDLSGWGDHLRLDDPLQAHTCKSRNPADQMFSMVGDKIKVSNTDRCLALGVSSGKPLPGVAILARTCTDTPMQSFTHEANGRIRVTGTDACLTAGNESTDASGPSHVWRVLSVASCDSTAPAMMTWQIGIK
jgi:hypothetical protein